MMKKFLLLFIPLIILPLCSWVDRSTVDTYYGSISFVSASYDVSQLSGRIEYYLMDYSHFGNTSSGALLNASDSTVKGVALIGGQEYPIQFSSNGELQIQQDYMSNTTWRTTWANYHLYPDIVPNSFSLSELAPIFFLIVSFFFVVLILHRGILS